MIVTVQERDVLEALRGVLDPELGIDVVALGLVYDVATGPERVEVALAMTSPACPLGEQIKGEAEAALRRAAPEMREVVVRIVDDPPWHPALMSEGARRKLGWA